MLLTRQQLLPILAGWSGYASTLPTDLHTSNTYEIPMSMRDTASHAVITKRANGLYELRFVQENELPECSICRRRGYHNHACE